MNGFHSGNLDVSVSNFQTVSAEALISIPLLSSISAPILVVLPIRLALHPSLFARVHTPSRCCAPRLALPMDSPVAHRDSRALLRAQRFYFQVPVIEQSFVFLLLFPCS